MASEAASTSAPTRTPALARPNARARVVRVVRAGGTRGALTLLGLALVLAGAVVLRLLVGGEGLRWPESADLWRLRVDRVLAGCIVGAALAVAGVLLQSLLRNPLASPDLLGLASGAGLGVMVATYVGYLAGGSLALVGGDLGSAGAALIGACAALALVYALSQRSGLLDPVSLVLVGVVVGIIASAGVMLLQHLLPDRGFVVSRWLLGALRDDATRPQLLSVGGVTLAVLGLGLLLARAMDAAALGEDEARSVGVPLDALRLYLFLGAGVLSAGSVILAGPVGFVGLVCPHVVRLLAGPGHRVLLPGSALAGAALVVGADALVKGVNLGAGRLPIGVLTSLIGGPVLLLMLRGSGRERAL